MSLLPSKINDMTGLHALITGAGSGLGLMIAKTYACHGATVYLVGRREDKLVEAKATIDALLQEQNFPGGSDGRAVVLRGDVSTKEGLKSLVSDYTALSDQNHLDVLVGNAGIYRPESRAWSPDLSPSEMADHFNSSTLEAWTETAGMNTASQYFLVGQFIPLLAAASPKKGNILITSSIAGLHHSPTSSNASYGASKAATNHLIGIMASRLAPLYIRCNAIAPGIFPSELVDAAQLERIKPAVARIPAKRVGEERDIGQAAVFLAMCDYVDGQVLAVDGGRTLGANGQ